MVCGTGLKPTESGLGLGVGCLSAGCTLCCVTVHTLSQQDCPYFPVCHVRTPRRRFTFRDRVCKKREVTSDTRGTATGRGARSSRGLARHHKEEKRPRGRKEDGGASRQRACELEKDGTCCPTRFPLPTALRSGRLLGQRAARPRRQRAAGRRPSQPQHCSPAPLAPCGPPWCTLAGLAAAHAAWRAAA